MKDNIPKKLMFFKSSDKEHHQQPDMQDLGNCCSPVFCIISGNVNCGKTSLLKNLLVHKKPHYERIVVYSPLGEATTEYSDVLDCELIDYVPDFDFFDREERNCFIVEDCDTKTGLSRDEKYKLGRCYMQVTIILMYMLCPRISMIYSRKSVDWPIYAFCLKIMTLNQCHQLHVNLT